MKRAYLTPTEAAIMRILRFRDGEPIAYLALSLAVFGEWVNRHALAVHVWNLRHVCGQEIHYRRPLGYYLGDLEAPSDIDHCLLYPDTFAEIQRVQAIVQAQRQSHDAWAMANRSLARAQCVSWAFS